MTKLPLRHRVRGLQIIIPLIAAAFALVIFGACDKKGGGGSSGSDAGPDSGSVAVLLTDGPVEPGEFEHIWVTYHRDHPDWRARAGDDLRGVAGALICAIVEDVSKFVALGRRVFSGCL